MPAVRSDEEIVREFKKYYKQYEDSATRVEAILALDDSEGPGVVGVLVPLLGGEDPEIEKALRRVLSTLGEAPARAALLDKLLSSKDGPRTTALLAIVAEGGYGELAPQLHELTEAKDWAGELLSGQTTTGRILVSA